MPFREPGVFVQCGIIRTHTNVKDLIYVQEETVTTPKLQALWKSRMVSSATSLASWRISLAFSLASRRIRSLAWSIFGSLSLNGGLKAPEKKAIDPKKLKKGDAVKIVSMGLTARISGA